MPPDEEPRGLDEVDRMFLNSIRELSVKLGKTVAEVSQDTTNQLARYREDVHRSIMGIQRRLVEFEVRMDDDGKVRKTRQEQLDSVLESIRKHQRTRMIVELVLIAAAVAYYVGSR